MMRDITAVIAGIAVVYLFGVPWLKYNLGFEWSKAVSIGMIPFLAGDLLKGAAAVFTALSLRPQIDG